MELEASTMFRIVVCCLMCLLLVPCYKAEEEEVIPHKEISPLDFLGPIDPGEFNQY